MKRYICRGRRILDQDGLPKFDRYGAAQRKPCGYFLDEEIEAALGDPPKDLASGAMHDVTVVCPACGNEVSVGRAVGAREEATSE